MNKTFNLITLEEWQALRAKIDFRLSQGFVPFSVVVGRLRRKRTHPQLMKYWCLIGEMTDDFREKGNQVSKEQVSGMMKGMFFYEEFMLPTGEIKKLERSISNMSETELVEFGHFINQVDEWYIDLKKFEPEN